MSKARLREYLFQKDKMSGVKSQAGAVLSGRFYFLFCFRLVETSDDADVFTVRLNGDGADVTPLYLFF